MTKIVTRDAARAAGLTRYFTGGTCKRGHIAERWTSGGGCCACHSDDRAEWKRLNPGKASAGYLREKAIVFERTPPWANMQVIARFYREAAALSDATNVPYQVDHIVPLRGDTVSGLHTESNLRVVTAAENMLKWNSFSGAAPDFSDRATPGALTP